METQTYSIENTLNGNTYKNKMTIYNDCEKTESKSNMTENIKSHKIYSSQHSGKSPKQTNKTLKKREPNKINKKKLWEIYDSDIIPINENNENNEKPSENSVITQEEQMCSLCNSVLIIMEDGFPTCSNTSCGIIYKDTLDYSPEWRFYGVDDKNTSDPKRCGNPINPLLQESSFGCKILCSSKSSYEMKKISK